MKVHKWFINSQCFLVSSICFFFQSIRCAPMSLYFSTRRCRHLQKAKWTIWGRLWCLVWGITLPGGFVQKNFSITRGKMLIRLVNRNCFMFMEKYLLFYVICNDSVAGNLWRHICISLTCMAANKSGDQELHLPLGLPMFGGLISGCHSSALYLTHSISTYIWDIKIIALWMQ